MKPTLILRQRIKNRVRFTTKDVAKGFYRGTGTGAMGSHTRYGNYLIDWRKVRHYVMPNLENKKLTPYVSGKVYQDEELPQDFDQRPYDPMKIDGTQYLTWWRSKNISEYDWYANLDAQNQAQASESESQETEDAQPDSAVQQQQQDGVVTR